MVGRSPIKFRHRLQQAVVGEWKTRLVNTRRGVGHADAGSNPAYGTLFDTLAGGYDVVTNDEGTTMQTLSSLPANERCATCGLPDSMGECDHTDLTAEEFASLGLIDDRPVPRWVDLDFPEPEGWRQVDLNSGKTRVVEKCYVCGVVMEKDPYGEACGPCMNPDMPDEINPYDTPGAWMDSTWPNEY